ncbi:MAG: pyridine nucleotide-disulfide oxidoreductase [Ignavibacteriae bacterium]|nr:MAG: pyridine nucleotide-disulfide oxidoreductase [Ignavibacteriota bacterium]
MKKEGNSIIEAGSNPKLGFGFNFHDLFSQPKLKELAELFNKYFQNENPSLYEKFSIYRNAKGTGFTPVETSKIIIDSARHLENFLGELFGIQSEIENLRASVEPGRIITAARKDFIQRRVFKNAKKLDMLDVSFKELDETVKIIKIKLFPELEWQTDEERATASMLNTILELEKEYKTALEAVKTDYQIPEKSKTIVHHYKNVLSSYHDSKAFFKKLGYDYQSSFNEDHINYELLKRIIELLESWSYKRYYDTEERKRIHEWVLYKMPVDMEYFDLVHNKERDSNIPERIYGKEDSLRKRDGFEQTDRRYNNRQVMWEVEYCIFCHERDKDSCSKGLHEKGGTIKKNPLGIKLHGCPLDEKISEMHYLKNEGRSLAALSVVMIDNPMCPGTGHRICNDCMKGCIYQKQEPVNIPQIETKVLTDVLSLPYGFEIFSLLTRWNPVKVERPYELPYNGKNILVVGLGPAGYTLAQHLLNEGFGVVGVDALKIEKVHRDITGYIDEKGNYFHPVPVKDVSDIRDELDERIFLGFGGVSEYGITVRWDKNFLKIIYLTLARRNHFRAYDGIRFGGTIEIDEAWDMGFDHIAIATGAGKPTIVKMTNNLSRGMRMASDFLMALQLTGAAKKESIANLQLLLPAVVIGGGLTAIDTATEAAAYYPVQVEKYLERYESIKNELGDEEFWKMLDAEETEIAKTFIEHGKEIRAERKRAAENKEEPNFVPLVRKWGGVTIAYRKAMQDSPAYRLNHEEVIKSLEEGIFYWEKLNPIEAKINQYGSIKEVVFVKQGKNESGKWKDLDEQVTLPARSVLVAAGTSPNVIYEREHPGTFNLDEWNQFFRTYNLDENSNLIEANKGETGFFTSYNKDGKFITVYGDNHPIYAGNVVKAMASARDGYKEIVKLFKDDVKEEQPELNSKFNKLASYLDEELTAVVHEINILTPTIIEVVVKAPLAARKFQPGQFYRLQNYEVDSTRIENTVLMMEGLALTGAWVDKEKGLLSLIILEMWGSSRLCRYLKIGQRVILMGPTGTPTHIPKGENVLLAGGGLGNAVLFSIAKAMKDSGNKVIYFAGYRHSRDLFKQDEVEEATDIVVWSNDSGDPIKPRRKQDRSVNANIVQAIAAYAKGELEHNGDKPAFDLTSVDRIIAIGSDRMMNAVKEARFGVLSPFLQSKHTAIGSINSTMQCMMKEVCAQCLQRHVDPQTGEEYFVFSCFNQDQMLDAVDFNNLNSRLKNNSVTEKLSKFWLDLVLKEME